MKFLTLTGVILAVLFLAVFLAFKLTPWPSSLLIRYAFTKGAVQANAALTKYVPADISEKLNQSYDAKDKDALLDVYYPSAVVNTDRRLPVVVWVHGGGWVSGHKEDIRNYCKILAGKGYATVSVDYSIAPEKQYPLPLKQISKALSFLAANAVRFHIDTAHFILAGDSGGAHIAAQTAAIITNTAYAQLLQVKPGIPAGQLSGLLLYCGPYDAEHLNLTGDFGSFLKTILWAYLGKKDFTAAPLFKTFSVINYVGRNFPPAFISAGNGDPLRTQSEALARKLAASGARVDTLFFAPEYRPSLPHEYQFNLNIAAGKQALERSLVFLDRLIKQPH